MKCHCERAERAWQSAFPTMDAFGIAGQERDCFVAGARRAIPLAPRNDNGPLVPFVPACPLKGGCGECSSVLR